MPAILIVEDDPSTLEAVSAMLEVSGQLNVRSAKDGIACLEMLREDSFDLMFLDLMMPRMDGVEVLRELRGGAAPRPGHIVVMSAHANADDQAGVRILGADQFLAKPFSLDQLTQVLETAAL